MHMRPGTKQIVSLLSLSNALVTDVNGRSHLFALAKLEYRYAICCTW